MNIVYHSSSYKHRLLAKTNSPSISLIRRTLTAEHEVVGSNPGWTTEKPGLQKPLYFPAIQLHHSCSLYYLCYWQQVHNNPLAVIPFPNLITVDPILWYISIQKTIPFRIYPRKLFTLSLYLLPLLKGHFLPGKRDTSSGSQKPGLTSIQGTPQHPKHD